MNSLVSSSRFDSKHPLSLRKGRWSVCRWEIRFVFYDFSGKPFFFRVVDVFSCFRSAIFCEEKGFPRAYRGSPRLLEGERKLMQFRRVGLVLVGPDLL